jgi:hypothetical protein
MGILLVALELNYRPDASIIKGEGRSLGGENTILSVPSFVATLDSSRKLSWGFAAPKRREGLGAPPLRLTTRQFQKYSLRAIWS